MTPSELLKQYTNMQVFIVPQGSDVTDEGVWTPVQVKKYHLGLSSYRALFWQDIGPQVAKGTKVKVRTIDGRDVTTDVLTQDEIWNLFRFPFSGKGSPEQVQATIQLMFRFRQNKSTVEQFAGGEGAQDKYNFIGLDCNGFVGNYLQRLFWHKYDWLNQKNNVDPGPDTTIKDLFLDNTDPLYALSDFNNANKSTYLFVWCSPDGEIWDNGTGPLKAGHIMITDPGVNAYTKDEVKITVSESTPADLRGSQGGPATSEYIIKPVTKEGNKATATGAVFTVWRGGLESNAMPVKIGCVK